MDFLVDWTEAHTEKFENDIITVRHRADETGLFTDEALADLMDKHPADQIDVCTMTNEDPRYPNRFRTGDFREANGKTLIEAAKAGQIWINLRQAMNIHPEYKAVLDDMYGSIAAHMGNKTHNARGGILISSPAAKVPYHCDQTHIILWHLRGRKRIYIYPNEEPFLTDEAYHKLVLSGREDDLPYSPDFENSARVYDLEPGQMISWPLNGPHRIENQEYCVSVTTEYSTRHSRLKNAVMFTNALMQKKLGVKSRWADASQMEVALKAVAGKTLKKARLFRPQDEDDLVTFKIDPTAANYILDTDPFIRNF